jgi:hypothetical protein
VKQARRAEDSSQKQATRQDRKQREPPRPAANAEQRISKMMNAHWTAKPKPKAAG